MGLGDGTASSREDAPGLDVAQMILCSAFAVPVAFSALHSALETKPKGNLIISEGFNTHLRFCRLDGLLTEGDGSSPP